MNTITPERIINAVHAIFEAADACFLITQGLDGSPSACLMQHFKPDADLVVWFGASPNSRKVSELLSNPAATLACQHPERAAYAMLSGAVTLIQDDLLLQKYWRESFLDFWPAGPLGGDYALLRFEPLRVEVMDAAAQLAPPPFGLRPAICERQGDGWITL